MRICEWNIYKEIKQIRKCEEIYYKRKCVNINDNEEETYQRK